eukprot:141754-Rhodomonas_salina.2
MACRGLFVAGLREGGGGKVESRQRRGGEGSDCDDTRHAPAFSEEASWSTFLWSRCKACAVSLAASKTESRVTNFWVTIRSVQEERETDGAERKCG